MVQVVGVRFKKAGKVYYFDPADLPISAGDKVVVETARGIEYGDVAVGPKEVPEDQVVQPLKKVLRIGTEKDAMIAAENRRKEKEAFAVALKKIEAHGLDMNLVDVEYTFDGSKNIFYFTSEGRVDFRELVRDLASVFRTRIEMRQIGVRDEAKLLGGIGPCGRILCCTSFLGDFAPVSIRMAKDQNLSLNPSKISGLCGRLMCCLRYEQETYEAAKKDPTLAPGYVPPAVLAAEAIPADLEELEERPTPGIGLLGTGESGVSARVARAAGIAAPERPARQESGGGRQRPKGDRGGRPQGGERPQQGGQQRQGSNRPQGQRPQGERPQGERPERQPRPQGERPHGDRPQGPRHQGDRPRADRPQTDRPQGQRPQGERPERQPRPQGEQRRRPGGERPQGEKPQGERPPQGHRHRHRNRHRGGGEKPQGENAPNPDRREHA